MTPSEISKLKQGDVVRHTDTGAGYIVLSNRTGVPTVVRTLEIHNASEWEHVYTPTAVPPPAPAPAPVRLSLVEKISELEKLGWVYNDANDRWTSPDESVSTGLLQTAWGNRHNHGKVFKVNNFSFAEARHALRDAGWTNPYGKVWRSPSGLLLSGARAVYAALTSGGNPS